jgi:hypothetical protein
VYEARTLGEFAARELRNDLRQVARSRARLSMWVFSSLAAVAFIGLRIKTIAISHYGAATPIVFDNRIAEIYTGVFLAYLAIPLVVARAVGAQFASFAEALVIGTSQLRVRGIFILLQLRSLWRTLARSFMILIILATSGSASPSELTRLTLLGILVVLVPPAYAVHINIASNTSRTIFRVCGIALLALGAAIGFDKVPHGGALMLAQVQGAWWPDLLVLAIAAFGVCVPPVADPIPEMLAATRAGGNGIAAQRIADRVKRVRVADGARASEWMFDLGGAWVILSARLAAFLRVRRPIAFAAGLFAWFCAGVAIGVVRHLNGPLSEDMIVGASFPVVLVACILAATIGRDLGVEIRNPIWWSGDASLTARLAVDSLASMWRFAISVAAVCCGYAAFGHAKLALLGWIAFTIAVWLARCCGYLLFAYFPAAIDQRGGLAGLRIFILFALALPVLLVAIVALFLRFPIGVQFALDALTAIVEAMVLVTVAARRIDGRLEAYLVS